MGNIHSLLHSLPPVESNTRGEQATLLFEVTCEAHKLARSRGGLHTQGPRGQSPCPFLAWALCPKVGPVESGCSSFSTAANLA
jgi:hypothetical protein